MSYNYNYDWANGAKVVLLFSRRLQSQCQNRKRANGKRENRDDDVWVSVFLYLRVARA